jgi:sigma-B regulation protein RsbU (phosphoserine phosphatase)
MIAQRILLIEPDRVLAATYASALKLNGYTVIKVATAQDGILRVDEVCPDLVICELQLVSHSGIEFLYEFRSYKDWQQVPFIVLSSVPPVEFKSSQQIMIDQLGVNGYLYKPNTTNRQLIDMVNKLLR